MTGTRTTAPDQDEHRYDGAAGALRRLDDQLTADIEKLEAEAAGFDRRAESRHEKAAAKRAEQESIREAISRLEQPATGATSAEPSAGAASE